MKTLMKLKNAMFEYIESLLRNPSGIDGYMSTLIMNYSNRKLYSSVLDNINVSCCDIVLEIGIGNGKLMHLVSKHDCKLICGIDISSDMINLAKAKNKSKIQSNRMNFKIGSTTNIPFTKNFFNIVYTVNTIYFWNDLKISLLEINRVLVNDGVFINVFFLSKRFSNIFSSKLKLKLYDMNILKNEYNRSGLKIINMILFDNDSTICIIAKKNNTNN